MTHRLSALILAVLMALAMVACAAPAGTTDDEPTPTATPETTEATASATDDASEPAAEGGEEEVQIDGSAFDPEELTIAVGTEVTWVNADSFAHTVTEGTNGQAEDDPIVDEEIEQDGSVSVTFDEPGTYEITCEIHPSMQMTITVEG